MNLHKNQTSHWAEVVKQPDRRLKNISILWVTNLLRLVTLTNTTSDSWSLTADPDRIKTAVSAVCEHRTLFYKIYRDQETSKCYQVFLETTSEPRLRSSSCQLGYNFHFHLFITFPQLQPCLVTAVSKQTIHINFTGELRMSELRTQQTHILLRVTLSIKVTRVPRHHKTA